MVDRNRIAENLHRVRSRIAEAALRKGRDPHDVRLIAVTKTVGVEEIRVLRDLGVTDMGENRVADGIAKMKALADPTLRWHLIGHLQRNKAREAFPYFVLIHSVESLRLAEKLSTYAQEADRDAEILVEVNISGEASKYGISPSECQTFLEAAQRFPRLRVRGFMTMAPWTDNPETVRPVFRQLRELRDRMRDLTGLSLEELSMGMSGDFEPAIEEGATMVRIGTALFEER